MVVVWLYGLMHLAGASLNIVTVTIATISLGVGIDYCIHVTERYRESRNEGASHDAALHAVGGACGAALVGSAASDIAGFAVIATSPMGLFASFGTFSATMIALSLIASLVLTTAGLGLLHGQRGIRAERLKKRATAHKRQAQGETPGQAVTTMTEEPKEEDDWTAYATAGFGQTDYSLWDDVNVEEAESTDEGADFDEGDDLDDEMWEEPEQLGTHTEEVPRAPNPAGHKHMVRIGCCDTCLGRLGGKQRYDQSMVESGREIRAAVVERDPHLEGAQERVGLCPSAKTCSTRLTCWPT